MNISNALKLGAAVVTVGVFFYAAHRSLANKKAVVEKQLQVNKIGELIVEVNIAAAANGILSAEDAAEIATIQKLTSKDTAEVLDAAISILRCKIDRITGKTAEIREMERKVVGADVVATISSITARAREKKLDLTEDQLNVMDSANIAVLADANKGTLQNFLTQLEEILNAVEDAE